MPASAAAPRILVMKLAAMGDTVMASTLIREIRRRWASAHLTWVTGQGLLPLVQRFDGVDRVLGVNADALLAGGGVARLRAAALAAWRIGRGPYDLALVAHADPRYATLLRAARIGELRVAADGPAPRALRPHRWHGEEYARLILSDEELAAPTADAGAVGARMATLRWESGGPPPRSAARHVLLAPGGARNVLRDDHLRRWPIHAWIALARSLTDAGCRLTLIGSASDAAEAEAVRAALPQVETAVGRDSLGQLLERLATADAVVTHDSGTLHLAQLTDTPAVALFGPTPPRAFVAPGAAVTVMSAAAGLACAPCYDGRGYAPCTDNRCLADVPAAQVAAAVLALLEAAPGAQALRRPSTFPS